MTPRAALESLGWRVTTLPDRRVDLTDTRGDGARVWLSVGDDGDDATLRRWLAEHARCAIARHEAAVSAANRARAEERAAADHLATVLAAAEAAGLPRR